MQSITDETRHIDDSVHAYLCVCDKFWVKSADFRDFAEDLINRLSNHMSVQQGRYINHWTFLAIQKSEHLRNCTETE